MAGRPRTMLKRVSRIFHQLEALADQFRELMPKQYQPEPPWDLDAADMGGDPLVAAWRDAVTEVSCASIPVEYLLWFLKQKAEAAAASADSADALDECADDEPPTSPDGILEPS